MFDSTSEFVFQARSGRTKVDISMRWPTDEEWAEHHRTKKITIHNLGRGITEHEIDSLDADLKLYRAVKLNGAPELTAAEASLLVKMMELADASDVVIDGEEATVTLDVCEGKVTHHLLIPTADQANKMQKSASKMLSSQQKNASQVRLYLDAPAKLWDECQGRSEDYIGAIPSLHKDAAIRAVIQQIENEMSPGNDEKFF